MPSKAFLRQTNESLVMNLIRENPGISRLEIARHSKLSPTAITMITARLVRGGLLYEEKLPVTTQLGRRPTALFLQAGSRLAIGVEITPSDAYLVLADLTGHTVEEAELPCEGTPEEMLARIHDTILQLMEKSQSPILGVGVSVPGILESATGKVIAATNLRWRNFDAIGALRRNISLPFYYENNSNLSALAEWWFGVMRWKDFIFVTFRGGIGAGVIAGGHLQRGAALRAGEFGHMSLESKGRTCLCGNRGCWEEYASDRAILRDYSLAGGSAETALEIVQRAQAGEVMAVSVLEVAAEYMALGFANIVMALNPEAIVVDDFVAAGWDFFEPRIWRGLRERLQEFWLTDLRIVPSEHALDSSRLGAVALVLSKYFRESGPLG
jgi:predicted NBD/HSP70 family sugar kinase